MANIFEELMSRSGQLNESARPAKKQTGKKKVNETKKISYKKFKVESRRIFTESDLDELEPQFNVDPESENEDEVVLVIDPEVDENEEVPEDAAQEMIGDSVYKCPVCGSNYVCDCEHAVEEGIDVDEDGVPTACPICGEDADQILIGEIAPAEDAPGESADLDPVTPDEGEEEEDVAEESLRCNVTEESPLDRVRKIQDKNSNYEYVKNTYGNSDKVYTFTDRDFYVYTEEGETVEDLEKEYNVKIKELGPGQYKISGKFNDLVDLYNGNYEEVANAIDLSDEKLESSCLSSRKLLLRTPACDTDLMFDDARFESMMAQMIKENYKGTPQFKTNKVSLRGNRFKIEYVVREGRKVTRGTMIGEGFDKTKRISKVSFRDRGAFTESYTKRPSFIVEFLKVQSHVIPSKISYNYKVKVNESLYLVSGKVNSRKTSK